MQTEQPEVNGFGDWLKSARKNRGMTQREVARLAGLSSAMVTRLESGDVGHTAATIEKIVNALASTPEEASTLLQEAKAASAGLSIPSAEISALAVELSQLDVDDQQYVLNLIRRLSASRQHPNAEQPPTEQEKAERR